MLELNTITLGDSYKLIKEIPDNSVDLVVIDPPYLYDNGGFAGYFGKQKKKQKEELKSIRSGFDYSILDELNRVMKKTNIYIWCSKSQIDRLNGIQVNGQTSLFVT